MVEIETLSISSNSRIQEMCLGAEHTSKTAAYPKNRDMRRLSFIYYDSLFLVQPCTDGQ